VGAQAGFCATSLSLRLILPVASAGKWRKPRADAGVQLAATTLTVLPVLLVFLIAQKQFVQGLANTGLKG
jgi:ABC-type glycerol-3-phosphate transport system permease component